MSQQMKQTEESKEVHKRGSSSNLNPSLLRKVAEDEEEKITTNDFSNTMTMWEKMYEALKTEPKPLIKLDTSELENTLGVAMDTVKISSSFIQDNIPPLQRQCVKNRTKIKQILERIVANEKKQKATDKEVGQLTTVWMQEHDKSMKMNELLSTLFMEVTDIDEHQKKIDELIEAVQFKTESIQNETETLATKVETNKETLQDVVVRTSISFKSPQQLNLEQHIDELKEEDELTDRNHEKNEDEQTMPKVPEGDSLENNDTKQTSDSPQKSWIKGGAPLQMLRNTHSVPVKVEEKLELPKTPHKAIKRQLSLVEPDIQMLVEPETTSKKNVFSRMNKTTKFVQNQSNLNKRLIDFYEEMNSRVTRCEKQLFPNGDYPDDDQSLPSSTIISGGGGGLEARINRILDERMANNGSNFGQVQVRLSPKKAKDIPDGQQLMIETLVSSHVSNILAEQDKEKDYELEEAVKDLSLKMKDVVDLDKKLLREIIIKSHLKTSTVTEGKFMLKEAKTDEQLDFTENEENLLHSFDDKLSNTRKQFKNMIIDFSHWQTAFMEQKRKMAEFSERIRVIEEQNEDLDFSQIEDKGQVNVTELIAMFRSHQAELLKKTVSQSDWSLVQTQISEVQKYQDTVVTQLHREIEVRERLERLEKLPGSIQKLQMDILKAENLLHEEQWKNSNIQKQIASISSSHEAATNLFKQISEAGDDLDAAKIVSEIFKVTQDCVHKEEFLDLRAETGDLLSSVNELKVFKVGLEQKQIDDHYQMVNNKHMIAEIQLTLESLSTDITKCINQLQGKLDIETFDEEMAIMHEQLKRGAGMGPSPAGGTGPVLQAKRSRGGMSVAEKTKMKEVVDTVERLLNQQKRINETLQKLKLDEFRKRMDEMAKLISQKADKSLYDHKFVDMLQQISKTNEMLADYTSDFNKNRQRVETKLENSEDKVRKNTELIKKFEKEIQDLHTLLMKQKQAFANQSSRKTTSLIDDGMVSQNKDAINDIDNELKIINSDLKTLNEEVRSLRQLKSQNTPEENFRTGSPQSNTRMQKREVQSLKQVEEKCMMAINQHSVELNRQIAELQHSIQQLGSLGIDTGANNYGEQLKKQRKGTRSTSQEKPQTGHNRPNQFIADQFTREVKQGRLQFHSKEQDHIARYGKGFSNLLQMAGGLDPEVSPQMQAQINSMHQYNTREQHHTVDSIMSPNGEEALAHVNHNMEDELMQDSRAAFGVYRPEIRHIPDPLTYKEAKRKYRMQDNHANMDDHTRRMKKLGTYRAIVKAGKTNTERTSSQIVPGGEMGKYLGHRGDFRTKSKMSHTQKGSVNGIDGNLHTGLDMAPVVHSIEMNRQNANQSQFSHRVDFPPVNSDSRRNHTTGRGLSQQSARAATSIR